eukprot:TRINITY_DN18519_c0_g1_i1.p1 TRINITY_DN18519_c0_g1~~TRINITY_DN18519_c0_g1_i1.p1  ORF type:complete len:542 (+),score=103.37 TRINITY_DN18519_c0_g1_i1:183-1628(+)
MDCSFLDFFLRETEKVHSLMRRYACPEEHPFTDWKQLPDPIIMKDKYTSVLKPNNVNLNKKVMSVYLEKILPLICKEGESDYGSSATCDIHALQSISKRIHYGKFVVESKFQQDREGYTKLIQSRDEHGLMKKLTDYAVEERLLDRVRKKASTYGQDPARQGPPIYKVDPEVPVKIYKEFLIPLTKEVELEYILRRLDGFTVAYFGSTGSYSHVVAKEQFSDPSVSLTPYSSIPQVFSAVLSSKADYGVVPLRNSLSGLFRDTHELLFTTEAKICAEIKSLIQLQLVSSTVDASNLSKITTIYSHPDAIAQCQKSLVKYCPTVKTIPVSSTSEGALRASLEPNTAAIAHLEVVNTFPSLKVIQPNIHDDDKATTQFLIISRSAMHEARASPSGRDKTMLVFGVQHKPGALTSALACFEKYTLNLTSIESHYVGGSNEPLFLIEFMGHVKDEKVMNALEALKCHTTSINVVGSFSVAPDPKK